MGLRCGCKCKRKVRVSDVTGYLKAVSMGKHNQGLFMNGSRFYSSYIGGLFTLFIAFVFIMFTISTIKGIVKLD